MIAELTPEGKVYLSQAGSHAVFDVRSRCVNAHDYAPDGTPLVDAD